MKKFILAHDLGTSGNKATLFNIDGSLVKSIVYPYKTNYFNSYWVEQDAQVWWKAVCETTQKIVEDIDSSEIASVSFSGQMMGCLCLDKNGEPLRNAIIWADQRAQAEAEKINELISQERFYNITGHRNSASYGLQKLLWVKNNEPEIYENTYKAVNAKDYIVFKLTGKLYSEFTDATGMAALDINQVSWSEEIIDTVGIDGSKLPELVESTFSPGGVTQKAAMETGLAEGTPVVMGGGDGLCAALGAGVIAEGQSYSYVGSSAWISIGANKPIFDDEMRTFNWVHIVPGMVTPCGTMQSAGGSYSWLKKEVCRLETQTAKELGKDPYDVINEEIEMSPPGAKGIIFLPYLLGERSPRWNSDAKGAFVGIKMENKREDLLRSVMEGITYNLNIILDVFKKYEKINDMVVIGGGAKGETWCQMMSDIYNLPIRTPSMVEEATSMGAAVTGAVGVGIYKDFSAIEKFIDINKEYTPNPEVQDTYDKSKQLFEGFYQALKPFYPKLK